MNQKIEKQQIERAISAINTHQIATNGEISNEYNGYISSFGAAVIQSGVLPALAFFESDGNSQKERTLIIKAIRTILVLPEDRPLFNQMMELNGNQLDEKEKEILEAGIALKLAIRTFKLKK